MKNRFQLANVRMQTEHLGYPLEEKAKGDMEWVRNVRMPCILVMCLRKLAKLSVQN